MENVAEKIRKLLAKAESNNEHEARAALLKARKLMAKYKVSEKDVTRNPEEVIRVKYTEDSIIGEKNDWFVGLSHVIAENHCCAMVWERLPEEDNRKYICFVGLGDDPKIAMDLFAFAVRFIHKEREKEQEKNPNEASLDLWEKSYAMGFMTGLKTRYGSQFTGRKQGMSLALTKPPQVVEYINHTKQADFRYKKSPISSRALLRGFLEGVLFTKEERLEGRLEQEDG